MISMYYNIRQFVNNMTIRRRLIIAFTLFLAVLSISIFLYFPYRFEQQAMSALADKTRAIANTVSYSIGPALMFDNANDVDESLNAPIQNKDIEYIVVIKLNNDVAGSFNLAKAQQANYQTSTEIGSTCEDNKLFRLAVPISIRDNQLGVLFLGVSLEQIHKEIYEIRAWIAFVCLVMFIIGSFFILLISSYLAKPFERMADTCNTIAEGDLSKRVIVSTRDEVGQFSEAFNVMVDKLESAYVELQKEVDVRKETEKELIIAKDAVLKSLENEKELNELKTRFISMVSHEYRTPLTVIMSSTYLLNIFYQQNQKAEFDKQLKRVQVSIQGMTNLLDSVLAIGRIDSGRQKLTPKKTNLTEPITEAIMILETVDKYKHPIHFHKSIEKTAIETDVVLLSHILNNLLSNAAKYSPEGSEIIVELGEQGINYLISITDSGIGIPEDDIEHLFDPFFRAANSATISGTGLGLAIVKRYIGVLNGEIFVQSQLNKGTTISFTLPKYLGEG